MTPKHLNFTRHAAVQTGRASGSKLSSLDVKALIPGE
jgi:hypothetical protein